MDDWIPIGRVLSDVYELGTVPCSGQSNEKVFKTDWLRERGDIVTSSSKDFALAGGGEELQLLIHLRPPDAPTEELLGALIDDALGDLGRTASVASANGL